ncbi:hypothetical protein KM043_016063 [Ampulex compressa]|nr:hypothetical protein KM043_016063 [Ampulex compressa]
MSELKNSFYESDNDSSDEVELNLNSTMNIARWILRSSVTGRLQYSTFPHKNMVFMDDHTIVCWHPEKKFPYEDSLPIPKEILENPSILRVGRKEITEVFRNQKSLNMMAEELAKVTYTTKHRWFPRSRDKRAKKTLPDRLYL